MTGRDNLSPDALKLLEVMVEEFRKKIAPDHDPIEFRIAAFELMDKGLAKIFKDGDRFSFGLTASGQALFGAAGSA